MTKVMLIEDDETMVSLLTTLLEIEGYEVAIYSGSESVIDVIKEASPDVVLLDVNLKNLQGEQINGFDVLDRIRAADSLRACRVLMSSGMDYRIESKEAGADGFILKPYMPNDLISSIKSISSTIPI